MDGAGWVRARAAAARALAMAASLASLASLAVATATAAAAPEVSVRKEPPRIEVHEFDPALPLPPEMPPLETGRDAVTACDFWCKPILTHRPRSHAHGGAGCVATIELLRAEVRLDLAAQSWLPAGASPALHEHERAHRLICEEVYRQAHDRPRQAAERLLGLPVGGEGADCGAATEDAVSRKASVAICQPGAPTTGETARRVISIYDDLTRAGMPRRPSTQRAIKAAFDEYHRERRRAELERARAAAAAARSADR